MALSRSSSPVETAVAALGNFLFRHRNKLFPVFYVLLFVPSPRLTGNLMTIMVSGFMISAMGQVVRIAAIGLKYIIRGGRKRRVYAEALVTDGIFAHLRNPLYLGNILILVGLGVMANSLLFNLVVSPLFIFMYAAIIRAEENFLGKKFGEVYHRYITDVNRWLPRLSGLRETFESMEFRWKRVLIREYTTTYIWLSGTVLVTMRNLAQSPDNSFYRDHWQWGGYALGGLLTIYLVIRTLKIRKVIPA